MRWLRGGNLRDALANSSFQLEAAALLIDQVASALAVAHRNGVIHRDLKPANILLDEDGNAYLSDFGIAKDMAAPDNALTGTGIVLGSPDYLSPEQARSESVTPQTDIYSLGVMLYELLTGQHPFPNCSSVERMYKHLNEPLPPITTLPAEMSDGINGIIQKATAKNPAQRYTDVLALAADFRREAALTQRSGDSIVEQLTFREQEILQMIVDGCSNKEIAQRLFVTVATVKWHIHGVYQKLHVRSRVQAVVKARELNLIVSESAAEPAAAESTFVALAEPENPYKGLRAFQFADARDFFGRERLIQRIMQRLGERDKLARFLAVIGPSGSGKSSVVKAGVMPALWRGDLRGSDRWFVIEMKPGAHPLDELEIALTRVAANQTASLREHLERDGRGLVRIAGLILPDDESELVIIIDQFEEVFTLVADETKRAQFIDLICQSIIDPRSRVRVIITLRADFYDRPLQYPEFGELVRSRMETVMPLSADELEAAIAKPAARVGIEFEPGLVATIAGDVHYQPGALPLLQYALTELFEQRVNHTLTHEAYAALGGAAGALAKRAEDLYHEQAAAGQEAIRQMFLRLVALGEGAEDTRRRVLRSELLALSDSEELMDEALDTYAAYRLLTLDHDPASRRPTVEIAHEAILREWERLRTWLNQSRHDIRQQRMLSAAAAEWSQADRDPSYLLRGARLEQMAGWAAESKLALTPHERSFLETSSAERARQEDVEQERQRRELATQRQLAEQQRHAANRLRYLVAGLSAFMVVAIVLTLFAFSREQQAQTAQRAAERAAAVNHSLVLASNALDAYEHGDSILATQLALESLNMDDPPPEAEIALREIAQRAGIRSILHGHEQRISAVAISADGRFILSGSCADAEAACTSGELILWDVQEQAEIRRMQGHSRGVTGIAFSPDGQTAISASADGTAILWSLPDGEVLRRFEGHTTGINSVAFSPDGETFVSASDDMTLIQWNIQTGDIIHTLEGHTDAVDCVAFSPDGAAILSGSADMTLIQWDAASGERLMTFEGSNARVTGVAFVPNQRIVSITRAGGLYLWDAATGTRLREQGFIGNPTELALSLDGRTVFFGEMGHLRAWNIDQWQSVYGLSFYQSGKQQITALATSTQGSFGVYGSEEATLIVWDLPSTGEIRRFGDAATRYTFAAVTPDNRSQMLGTAAGEVIMQDRVTGEEIRRFSGADGWVWRIVFSPDSQHMLVASADWFGGSGRGSFMLRTYASCILMAGERS
jgi:WD40 repeat protein/DNA-binding CsgD family transcriptional regulator